MYRVLLVEDDSQIREVIGDYFGRREKIALDLAQDGNMGLTKILNEEYDLIIPDHAWDTPHTQAMLEVLRSDAFKAQLEAMGGYTLDAPGEIIEIK